MAKSIPKDIKTDVLKIVEAFNKEYKTSFQMTFRGQFAYLAKMKEQPMANIFRQMIAQKMGIPIEKIPKQRGAAIEAKLGRLKYNGQMDSWDFAVFKYSREFYDSDDWMFPGAFELNGTIEGVSEQTDRVRIISTADLDLDGDIDLLSASSNDDKQPQNHILPFGRYVQ